MKKLTNYIFLIFIIIGGCKKVELDPTPSGDPVFSVDATLNGTDFNWVAGDDDIYMFTEFSKDSFDVYTLSGRFALDDNCVDTCEESLTFSIRSSTAFSSPSQFEIETAISLGDFQFFKNNNTGTGNVIGYNYDFFAELIDPVSNQPFTSNWFIVSNNDTFNFTGSTVESFPHPINGNLAVSAVFETDPSGTCSSRIELISNQGFNDLCRLDVNIDEFPDINSLDSNIVLVANLSNANPNSVSYSWGNGFSGSTLELGINEFIDTVNSNLTLTATDPNSGCVANLDICYQFDFDSISNSLLFENFSVPKINYERIPILDVINQQFSTAIIEYQNANEIVSSKYSSNNDDFVFMITKIEDFEDNEIGEKTKKLTIIYEAELCNSDGGNCKMIEGTGVIGIAYPN